MASKYSVVITNVLVKLSLTYNTGVPSVSAKNTYSVGSMNLPSVGTVGPNTNTFGDIAINNNTGTLYASTSRGRFYSVNLTSPTTGFTEIVASPGNDRTVGLQLVYNNSTNVLYGHNHKSGDWYTINTSTGAKTPLDLNTSLFRDIAGNTSSSMYGNDANGDIYEVDISLSTPTTLSQFFLPKGTETTGANNLEVTIQTDQPDQAMRLGIFETTTEPNIKIDWGDKATTTVISEGYQEHVYEDLINTDIKIQGDAGGGELRVGGKVKPVYNNGWSNDYSNVDIIKAASAIDNLSNLSSIEFRNNRNLASVPGDLFTNVISTINNLDNTFENTGLTNIPSGLLTSMTGVNSYVATFKDCDNITSVPIPFFDVHTGITSMANFLDWTEITNYDEFLDWLYTEANAINLTNITLGACGNTTSNSTGITARANLINNLNWTINDGDCGISTTTTTTTTSTTPSGSGTTTTTTTSTTPAGSGEPTTTTTTSTTPGGSG